MTDIRKVTEHARACVERGSLVEAEILYKVLLKASTPPDTGLKRIVHGEAAAFFAQKAVVNQRFGEATDWYREAISADPYAVDYRVDVCRRTLIPMGLLAMARIEAVRATKIAPDAPHAWRILAHVEHELDNVDACIAAYQKQLDLIPDDPNARLDMATIRLDMADYDAVAELCAPLLETDRRGDALLCLAMVAYRLGNHLGAIALYDEAIEAKCYDPDIARWNMSLAMHSIGRYKVGWQLHECRGTQKTSAVMSLPMKRFSLPIWKGESAPARIHVHEEMGFGDVLCLSRYLPMLVERGHQVALEVRAPMVDLMRESFPDVKVVEKAVDYPGALGIPLFDYHIPMLSLPAVFNTSITTVPWQGPYLKPRYALRSYFGGLLPVGQLKVGLCWSSGIRPGIWLSEYGKRKSMHLDDLLPLWVVAAMRVLFVSLQVGPERAQNDGALTDVLPAEPTWEDTAALIANLDLVITADTAVAHLAGAMGKPVWLMMHTEGSWHWMTRRLDSPWYPSAILFRQKEPHGWSDVIAAVAEKLRTHISRS